jgi:hypothetical protein
MDAATLQGWIAVVGGGAVLLLGVAGGLAWFRLREAPLSRVTLRLDPSPQGQTALRIFYQAQIATRGLEAVIRFREPKPPLVIAVSEIVDGRWRMAPAPVSAGDGPFVAQMVQQPNSRPPRFVAMLTLPPLALVNVRLILREIGSRRAIVSLSSRVAVSEGTGAEAPPA